MRITKLLRILLGLEDTRVVDVGFDAAGLVTEASPQAQIIFDRFHVQRLAQDAVDEVRRDEARAATSEAERKQLKGTRWQLFEELLPANRNAPIERRERLGGLFNFYYQRAA